jgi:hypothetical protein
MRDEGRGTRDEGRGIKGEKMRMCLGGGEYGLDGIESVLVLIWVELG